MTTSRLPDVVSREEWLLVDADGVEQPRNTGCPSCSSAAEEP
jgi:hypothetical protein